MTISRRRLLTGATAGAAAAYGGLKSRRTLAQSGPLRLPILTPLSGPIAIIGESVKLGAELTAQVLNKNGGVGGRTLEPFFIDDKGRPNDAVAAAREVIANGHRFISGLIISPSMLATLPVLNETKTVLLATGGTSMALTNENFTPYFFPGVENDYQRSRAMSQLAAQKLPNVTQWGGLISEAQAYVETYSSFQRFAREEYSKSGKQLNFADPMLFKFGTTDFRAQLSQLANSNIEGIYNMVLGADGLGLWQQAQAFNLDGKIKGVIDQTIDFSVAKTLKKRLPPNLWSMVIWYYGLYPDDPLAKSVFEAYVAAKGDRFPSGYMGYGSASVSIMSQAVAANNGVIDPDAIIRIMETTPFQTVKGVFKYRKEDHLLLADINAAKVVPSDDDAGIKVVDQVKMHSADLSPPPNPGKPFKY